MSQAENNYKYEGQIINYGIDHYNLSYKTKDTATTTLSIIIDCKNKEVLKNNLIEKKLVFGTPFLKIDFSVNYNTYQELIEKIFTSSNANNFMNLVGKKVRFDILDATDNNDRPILDNNNNPVCYISNVSFGDKENALDVSKYISYKNHIKEKLEKPENILCKI